MTRHETRLDERGAMALVTVFFAVFAVGMLYAFVGSVEAVLFRERMQDAVDSAALSGAVMHARSMNFIVLVNMVMAALLAILIAIKLAETLAIIGMIIAAVLAWPTFGASLAAIPVLKPVQEALHDAYDSLKGPVDTALEGLHTLSSAVQAGAVVAAELQAQSDLEKHWKPPVKFGAVIGRVELTLPLEDDSFGVLCEHGGETAAELALLPLDPVFDAVPPFAKAKGALVSATGEMTGAMQSWFCGGSNDHAPTFERTVERAYPRFAANDLCEDTNAPPEESADACSEASRFDEDSTPDKDTGKCRAGTNCSIGGPYEQRVAAARVQCDPQTQPTPFFYWYQLRQGHVRYLWNVNHWERQEPTYDPPTVYPPDLEHAPSTTRPPCGPPRTNRVYADGYNVTVRRASDVNEVLPVCSTEQPPLAAPLITRGTDPDEPIYSAPITFTEVTHILGCKKNVQVSLGGGDDTPPQSDGDSRSPKRVLAGVDLGAEDFQIRGFVVGDFDAGSASRLVRLSLFGRRAPEQPLGELRALGNVAVAQTEYFYDGAEGRDAWMWNMKWRARLKRFKVPESGALDGLTGACGAGEGGETGCGALGDVLGRLGDLIAH